MGGGLEGPEKPNRRQFLFGAAAAGAAALGSIPEARAGEVPMESEKAHGGGESALEKHARLDAIAAPFLKDFLPLIQVDLQRPEQMSKAAKEMLEDFFEDYARELALTTGRDVERGAYPTAGSNTAGILCAHRLLFRNTGMLAPEVVKNKELIGNHLLLLAQWEAFGAHMQIQALLGRQEEWRMPPSPDVREA